MIAIIDYDAGNIKSVEKALLCLGAEVEVTRDAAKILQADHIILPGVGAFADAASKLKQNDLHKVVISQARQGKPLMGICLGMHLLFDKSYEYGEHEGLGLLKGSVVPMEGAIPEKLKIPHIGWNALHFAKPSGLFKYINENDCVYFVHSYFATDCDESVIATTEYGREMTAAVELGNIKGCQFHPEKSGKLGLAILKAFCEN